MAIRRRTRRRLRRIFEGVTLAEIDAVDFSAWRQEVRALAAQIALDACGGDLRSALVAMIEDETDPGGLDLPEAAWARLDLFEGDEYERHEVLVTLADGRWERAWTYLLKPGLAGRLDAGDWDEAAFEREGKARFVARYVGFDAI